MTNECIKIKEVEMKLEQMALKNVSELGKLNNMILGEHHFGLVFGHTTYFKNPEMGSTFAKAKYPIIGCSTAGEISNNGLSDDSLIFTSVKLEGGSTVKSATGEIAKAEDSFKAGVEIAKKLQAPDLKLIFILGTGVNVNGSDLIRGMQEVFGKDIEITGGLAGDGGEFKNTFTMLNGQISSSTAVAVGLYGKGLKIGFGSQGGWKPFGPPRKVTKVKGNILYELDGQSALKVYETYLGDKAKDLPASGLLYPFAIIDGNNKEGGLIRTILGIDKAQGSLTLAGDVPEGGILRLMHTGTEGLIDGAERAAEETYELAGSSDKAGLAILVSCVGRKLVMGSDTDEELDAVKNILPKNSTYAGFYSYGEICPFEKTKHTMLHNQTMTITFLTD